MTLQLAKSTSQEATTRAYNIALLVALVLTATSVAPSLASANVTSHGGPVAIEPHVYPIFWGNAWNSGTPATERSKVMAMYNDFNESTGSGWQSILTQYWAPKEPAKAEEGTAFAFVSHSVLIGGSYTDSEGPPSGVTKANMEAEIKKAIEAKGEKESWPAALSEATVNDQFAIFTPSSTTWGSELSKGACGEHYFHTGTYVYDRVAWEYEKSPTEHFPCSATVTAGHEYAEAITDPYANGWRLWTQKENNEIADICSEYARATWPGGVEVPKLWDNHPEGVFEECTGAHLNPPQVPPEILTKEATSVQPSKATLHGIAERNGLVVGNYYFNWGSTESYGHHTRIEPGGNLSFGPPSEVIEGLEPNTSYHYRLIIEDAGSFPQGIQTGADQKFTTPPAPPVVTTEAATGVTVSKATLHGVVNPGGASTKYRFEWGETEAYGNKVEGEAGSGRSAKSVESVISGLKAEKTYDFRLFAENSAGTRESKGNFATPSKPTGTTESASYTNTFEPQLNATVNPNGTDTHYQFEYGETEAYGSKSPATAEDIGSGLKAVTVSATLKGLKRNKTFHFRVVASNEAGTTNGSDMSFATLPPCKGAEEKCAWSTQTTPNPQSRTEDTLEGVSCTSATQCLAIGENHYKGNSVLELWNGTEWSIVKEAGNSMTGISCGSSTVCMAIGTAGFGEPSSMRVYSESSKWHTSPKTIPIPAGATQTELRSVSCSSESACTAVGTYYTEANGSVPLAERWNGTEWSIQSTPLPSERERITEFNGVSCASSTECIAVGMNTLKTGEGPYSHYAAFSERWNGTEWTVLTTPNPTGYAEAQLEGVSCPSTTSCMAVGNFNEGSGPRKTLTERWNGSAWSVQSSPNPSEAKYGTTFLGVSCLSSTSCFAVGDYLNTSDQSKAVAESWNGTEWTLQTTPNPTGSTESPLRSVSCSSSVACTAVGKASPGPSGETSVTLAERYE